MSAGGGDDPLLGRELGRFRLEAKLGQGGMGTVYRARDLQLDRTVALKLLPPRLAALDEYRERFAREARRAAKLEHAHIVRVYDSGEVDDHVYIAMQFMPGGSLQERLAAAGRLPPTEAARIVRDAARGLAKAHRMDVIHRDIKPANILIDDEGQARLADFGLVKATDGSEQTLTQTGMLLGTPQYMAPEQCQGLKDIDGRADLYSLGLVLYRALSGVVPARGDTPLQVIRYRCEQDPEPLDQVAPDVPRELVALTAALLVRDRSERLARAEELVARLDAFLAGADSAAATPTVAMTGFGKPAPTPQATTVELSQPEPASTAALEPAPPPAARAPRSAAPKAIAAASGALAAGPAGVRSGAGMGTYLVGCCLLSALLPFGLLSLLWLGSSRQPPAPFEDELQRAVAEQIRRSRIENRNFDGGIPSTPPAIRGAPHAARPGLQPLGLEADVSEVSDWEAQARRRVYAGEPFSGQEELQPPALLLDELGRAYGPVSDEADPTRIMSCSFFLLRLASQAGQRLCPYQGPEPEQHVLYLKEIQPAILGLAGRLEREVAERFPDSLLGRAARLRETPPVLADKSDRWLEEQLEALEAVGEQLAEALAQAEESPLAAEERRAVLTLAVQIYATQAQQVRQELQSRGELLPLEAGGEPEDGPR